ncbi:Cytokinin dehydrogenase 1, FAD and cytokinin binding [Castilleja foliolosa]|uniref:cytokinin dehydrogenase n=1 Tax=Castilleja foliolosa TaxID=1961234 RepID=A0ABD3EK73_9LAMI
MSQMAPSPSSIPSHMIYALITILCIIIANPWPQTTAYSFGNRLRNDTNSITIASNDYGNIVHEKPSYVLDPWGSWDIVQLTRSESLSNKTIAARGCAHSVRGQAMALNGVVVNMTTWMKENQIRVGSNKAYVDVGGGTRWIDVLRATLKLGLAPRSWTDYLYITVGGTLSNAGISGQTFLHGPQIANVLQLDVVTGKGQIITCSPNANSELFYGVLGGLGQFGIITRARIVLEKAPTKVKWARLIYSDFATFTRDQEHLISTNVSSYVEGFLIINESTTAQWRPTFPVSQSDQSHISALLTNQSILYTIEVAKYYDNHTAATIDAEFQKLLNELNFNKGLNFSTDASFFDFITRVINLDTPETGALLPHIWLNLFIPKSGISDFNRLVLAGMLPRFSDNPGVLIFYPVNKNKWDDRMSAVTPNESVFYALGVLNMSPVDKYQIYDDFSNEVLRVCNVARINVKEYLPNYKNQSTWINHFGNKWGTFSARKNMFDPKKRLSPGQKIFN